MRMRRDSLLKTSMVIVIAFVMLSLTSCLNLGGSDLSAHASFSSGRARITLDEGALSITGSKKDAGLSSYTLYLDNMSEHPGRLCYRSFLRDKGWQAWQSAGELSGGSDEAILGVQIMLLGHYANYYDISYRVKLAGSDWQEWDSNGTLAGTTGDVIAGLQVKVTPKSGEIRDTTWTITEYGDDDGRQGEFYTLVNNDDDTLIVIDGGWDANTEQVRSVIALYGGKVDYWFITHYDADHVSAFNNIYADPGDIIIGTVYATPLDYDLYCSYAVERWWDTPEVYKRFIDQTEGDPRIEYLSRDDSFTIRGLDVYVFNSYDQIVADTGNPDVANYGSLMFNITGLEDTFLVCGDVYGDQMGDILLSMYGSSLSANICQPGHHGNHSMSPYFYEVVDPDVMFFDGPKWLTESDEYTAKALMEWCTSNGITTYEYSTAPNTVSFE